MCFFLQRCRTCTLSHILKHHHGFWSAGALFIFFHPCPSESLNSPLQGGTNSRQQHKLLSCEVKSAAYQLVTIHIELTACVAFYLQSLFSIFPPRLCPLHNNQENGNVIKMILQFQLIKIQSQWGRWSTILQFSILQLTGFPTAAQFIALYCP